MKIRALFIAVIAVTGAGCKPDPEWAAVRRRCKTLELGMTEKQVREVMGPPVRERTETPGRGVGPGEPNALVLLYPGDPKIETKPMISINTRTGRVDFIACDDNHIKASRASPSR